MDLRDDRFSRLLDGDHRFGIDPTSSDFKQTEGMRDILAEQRVRRGKREGDGGSREYAASSHSSSSNSNNRDSTNAVETSLLVDKLKNRVKAQGEQEKLKEVERAREKDKESKAANKKSKRS